MTIMISDLASSQQLQIKIRNVRNRRNPKTQSVKGAMIKNRVGSAINGVNKQGSK
jgi:hypothetical protein